MYNNYNHNKNEEMQYTKMYGGDYILQFQFLLLMTKCVTKLEILVSRMKTPIVIIPIVFKCHWKIWPVFDQNVLEWFQGITWVPLGDATSFC